MTLTARERVQELLDTFAVPGANAAELFCDRHPADNTAFTVVQSDLSCKDVTYGELRGKSARFAAALSTLGVRRGDHVATLMGKSAELVVALLGIWRLGAVDVPLFTAFAHDAIAFRVQATGTRLVICDADQRRKLFPPGGVPNDASPLVVVARGEAFGYDISFAEMVAGTGSFDGLEAEAAAVGGPGSPGARDAGPVASGTPVAVGGDGILVQLFTSGTTGTPKGVPIPLRSVASFAGYQEFGLDVRPGDVFWNMADPGWAYGLYFALLAPLATGTRSLLLSAGFSPQLTWAVMEKFQVTNFAAAPTVYRALRAGSAAGQQHALRRASSAGEPLTPDVIDWGREVFGVDVRDHYGQTEHGMVAGNAWHGDLLLPLRPGSMGVALPGWSVDVLSDSADSPAEDGEPGRVAINIAASPFFWFTSYVDAPEKSAERFAADGAWYLTGDAGSRDADGYIYFSSRDDDVIIMAGYRIGPFEVESVLVTHAAVAEAAVIGVPDEIRGEVLEAYVVLNDGHEPSEALVTELALLVKAKFAAHAYPRRVHFQAELPKTASGKVQRFILRHDRTAKKQAGTVDDGTASAGTAKND
ncbi:AMP-dependent synthetase [Arthrobacter livingstonensis]|uniref:AMP-dependent synthetase n=1 Tax=Arthrobacter livingstonensis TaxID=670078 RepID=A0A2V5L2E6_9MICC|nr:AMP-binding protein [Arthrobacter livingstonensis]PYI64304.1 AMP-dependent synthetase [Arthrobacter livingstonensis]